MFSFCYLSFLNINNAAKNEGFFQCFLWAKKNIYIMTYNCIRK